MILIYGTYGLVKGAAVDIASGSNYNNKWPPASVLRSEDHLAIRKICKLFSFWENDKIDDVSVMKNSLVLMEIN